MDCSPVSLGCSAILSKILFPRPFFDLAAVREYVLWSAHFTSGTKIGTDGAVEPVDAPIWFTPLPQETEDYHASVSLHSSMPVQRRVFRKLQARRFVRSTVRSWHHCPQQQRVISVFVEIVRANCLACVKMFACCLDSNLT